MLKIQKKDFLVILAFFFLFLLFCFFLGGETLETVHSRQYFIAVTLCSTLQFFSINRVKIITYSKIFLRSPIIKQQRQPKSMQAWGLNWFRISGFHPWILQITTILKARIWLKGQIFLKWRNMYFIARN